MTTAPEKKSAIKQFPPGSDRAIAAGCKCPVGDNHHGKGVWGLGDRWLIIKKCKLHWIEEDSR